MASLGSNSPTAPELQIGLSRRKTITVARRLSRLDHASRAADASRYLCDVNSRAESIPSLPPRSIPSWTRPSLGSRCGSPRTLPAGWRWDSPLDSPPHRRPGAREMRLADGCHRRRPSLASPSTTSPDRRTPRGGAARNVEPDPPQRSKRAERKSRPRRCPRRHGDHPRLNHGRPAPQ